MPRRKDVVEDGEFAAPEQDDGGRPRKKRMRSKPLIRDSSEEEDEESDDESGKKKAKRSAEKFFDIDAIEADSEEELTDDDETNGDPFIDDQPVDDEFDEIPEDDNVYRRMDRRRPLLDVDEGEEFDNYMRKMQERFGEDREISDNEPDEEEEAAVMEMDQQALLPSIRDPKLWKVKCAKGHERKLAVCLMQKAIDRSNSGQPLQIGSVIALDNLKEFIYIEAAKEAHVKEACRGMRNLFASGKLSPVPIKEMVNVLAVQCKGVEILRDSWVRIKRGTFKGELAKVDDIDDVAREVTLKFIPPKVKDPEEIMFKEDGFCYKTYSIKSISTEDIQPTFEELYKFRELDDGADLSTLSLNKHKCGFFKGDRVFVVGGDLKGLKGWVEKVEEDIVHIKPNHEKGGLGLLPASIAFSEKEICKCFLPGNHVKVVAGVAEGATGTVVSIKDHVVNIVSDNTEEEVLPVFAGYLVESCEVVSTRRGTQPDESDRQARAPVFGRSPATTNVAITSRNGNFGAARPPPLPQPRPMHKPGGRFSSQEKNSLVGARIKIRMGRHKGYSGIVKRVQENKVWVEVEALTHEVLVNRNEICSVNIVNVSTPIFRENPRCGMMTPMRDVAAGGATPVHDSGMRTPMRDRAWNPYSSTPTHTPMRSPWEDRSPPPFMGY
ncbi:OLC1v1018331C1 [Oldenlandia corymbosa var. corymbosa]|uniref:Transcription elongation factor SPT5 n=1 Tax=Oldenlandia corymbosa var. corymbosa TaxID=529605 RepID=A0AAV1EBE6_OLDCO|nr:OLC1v1018331C1 [Oldenlandia corymbosa var. corymbosa]